MKYYLLFFSLIIVSDVTAQGIFTINGDTLKKDGFYSIFTAEHPHSGYLMGIDSFNVFIKEDGVIRKIPKTEIFRLENKFPDNNTEIIIINGDTLRHQKYSELKTSTGIFKGVYYGSDPKNIFLEGISDLIKIPKSSIISNEAAVELSKKLNLPKAWSFAVGSALLTNSFEYVMKDYKFPITLSAGIISRESYYSSLKLSMDAMFWFRNNKDYDYTSAYDSITYKSNYSGGHLIIFTLGGHLQFGYLNPHDNFNIYGIAGVGINFITNTTRTTNSSQYKNGIQISNYSYSSSSGSMFFIGLNIGVGMSFKINKNLSTFFEIKADDVVAVTTYGAGYLGILFVPVKAGVNLNF